MINLLVQKEEDLKSDIYFTPEYTNQIFRENETVQGFTDLKIKIYFMSA